MSDSIQSISQGNYILQGTVATSAGIVGDGSTQNPIRLDETVLYNSSAKWAGITFSEPASNFEKIRVYVNTGRPHIFEWPSNAFTNNYWPGDMYGCGWGAKPAMTVFEFSANNTGFNVNGGWHTESTASVNWTVLNVSSTWVRPFKVVGINRKV